MVVIKIGGEILEFPQEFAKFAELLKNGSPAAVVFGAGVQINRRLKETGIPFQFYKGERITTMQMLEIINDEFRKIAGRIKDLLEPAEVQFIDGSAIFACRKKSPELGFVGEIVSVTAEVVKKYLKEGKIVLVSPIGKDGDENLCNVNADVSASALAVALSADSLIYFTKVKGVLDESNNLIRNLNGEKVAELMEKNIVSEGMIPKVNSAISALKNGVGRVLIGETAVESGY
ncbi:MAG: acetylglutamate kinase [bacterium]